MSSSVVELDLIEELRLRRWARENFVAAGLRERGWHDVILDEMRRKDDESARQVAESRLVPSEA